MAQKMRDARYQLLLDMLVDARKKKGTSQSDLAARLGQPQQFVSRYELSKRRLDVIEFLDIATSLGLDPVEELAKILPDRS